MADMDIQITDNSGEILKAMEQKKKAALEAIGIQAEGYAKKLTPVDTGRLKNSISHAVQGDACYIGTNVEYAVWHELGTGIYASDGNGRKTPWAYYDKDGKLRYTRGVKPKHMLKRAASEHTEEYKRIIESIMKR